MRAAPTDDELAMLAGYRGDEDDLTKPERFLLQLSRVSRLHAKLRSLAFSLQFPEACQEVSDALEAIQSAGGASTPLTPPTVMSTPMISPHSHIRLRRLHSTPFSIASSVSHRQRISEKIK